MLQGKADFQSISKSIYQRRSRANVSVIAPFNSSRRTSGSFSFLLVKSDFLNRTAYNLVSLLKFSIFPFFHYFLDLNLPFQYIK